MKLYFLPIHVTVIENGREFLCNGLLYYLGPDRELAIFVSTLYPKRYMLKILVHELFHIIPIFLYPRPIYSKLEKLVDTYFRIPTKHSRQQPLNTGNT